MATEELLVNVSIDDEHDVDEVAARLSAAGMTVERSLRLTGTITGSAPADHLEQVRAVDGVADVETAREIHLPPPDSPIQ